VPVFGPVFNAALPAFQKMYTLTCEFAAAYIVTCAFDWKFPPGVH
jgi:peptidoglycan hydrolase-like protein with peptidoglycan-binding domain